MITSVMPNKWESLQAEVSRILSECGFKVDLEKVVASARGDIELDVYAEEDVQGRKYSIACECKHWKRRIPQTVIHAFRTVVAEIGANVGYLISLRGFQSGSFKASELTNLRLVTWIEFQDLFEESWYDEFFSKEIDRRLDALMTYSEPFAPAWWDKMTKKDRGMYMKLKEQYDLFGMVVQSFGPYHRVLSRVRREPIPALPLRQRMRPDHAMIRTIPDSILDETAYRQFLEACTAHGEAALAKYRVLRDRYYDPKDGSKANLKLL